MQQSVLSCGWRLAAGGWKIRNRELGTGNWKLEIEVQNQPRPMNGIFVAITVMNCTFASSGRPAM
jgi:hypothetical protein